MTLFVVLIVIRSSVSVYNCVFLMSFWCNTFPNWHPKQLGGKSRKWGDASTVHGQKRYFSVFDPAFWIFWSKTPWRQKKKIKARKTEKKLKAKQRQKKQKHISNWKQQTTLNCQLKEAVRLLGYNNDIQRLTIQQTTTDISDREQPSLTLSKFFPVCRWDETTSCPTCFYKVSDQCRNWATAHRPLP